MKIKEVLENQIELIKPDKKEISELKKITKDFVSKLNLELSKYKPGGEVFIGGSFAKGTLIKKGHYDIDVFVRFGWEYDDLSKLLENPLRILSKKNNWKMEKIHGSRDYYRVYFFENKYFEVIPVTKIKRPSEEKNVTDLSYFHVSYVKRKIKGFEKDVILAKSFCHAQKVYGAETYVRGFSGYALELLVINYNGFVKMLKELLKVKDGERLIIDPRKHYKRKNNVLFELNEAKLQSPVILIDPTYKERNVLAALSRETFRKFQKSAKKFFKNPSKDYFIEKKVNVKNLKKLADKKKAEFLQIKLYTNRQEGDIAGTKMKKFSGFLEEKLKKYFEIIKFAFDYDSGQESNIYFVLKSKKEIIQMGPPMYTKKLRKHIRAFKDTHKKTYVKENILYAKMKIDFSGKDFIKNVAKNPEIKDMGIIGLEII